MIRLGKSEGEQGGSERNGAEKALSQAFLECPRGALLGLLGLGVLDELLQVLDAMALIDH